MVDIPDDQDLIVTDIVVTCRSVNPCPILLGEGAADNLTQGLLRVAAPLANGSNATTASHSFATGLRLTGGGSAQLVVRNETNASFNSNASVTITGYFVKANP